MTVPTSDHPVIAQLLLRQQLRCMRTQRGETFKKLADAVEWSVTKLARFEAGDTKFSVSDVRILLMHYGIDDEAETERFLNLARSAKARTWRDEYRNKITPDQYAFLGYEEASFSITQLHSTVVPDLLQTEDYASAWTKELVADPRERSRASYMLAERQAIIKLPAGRDFEFLVDESVLRRPIGDADVMYKQVAWLTNVAVQPHVSIRVIPYSAGAYRGMSKSVTHFQLPTERDLPTDDIYFVTCIEAPLGEISLFDAPDDTRRCLGMIGDAQCKALTTAQSLDLMHRINRAH